MPRPALNKPRCSIEIPLDPDDKQALVKWCASLNMTVAEVVRYELKPLIDNGYTIS